MESCNILHVKCLRARQEGPQKAARSCVHDGRLGSPGISWRGFCDEYTKKEINQVSLAGFLQILQRYYFCTWQGATGSRDGVMHGSDTNLNSENACFFVFVFFFCTKAFMECQRLWVQTVPQITTACLLLGQCLQWGGFFMLGTP